ncbi:putative Copia-like polyprotein/retrotransposon, partial [Rhizoctonia solani 123E]
TTPMLAKLALPRHEGPPPADNNYLTYIGMLMYASLGTRPDICYATQYLAQFSNCYGNDHLTAVKRVFRYLKGTADRCITYDGLNAGGEPKETGFVDANWGLDIIDRRSVSGLVFMLAGGAVAWSSKKQATVSLSSMEAEYMGVAYGVRHALWLRTILQELGFERKLATPIFTDSLSAIALSRDSQLHGRSKHIRALAPPVS